MPIQFDKLISTIAGAVVEANHIVKQNYISNLTRFFKEDGSPITQVLKIPKWAHDSPAKVTGELSTRSIDQPRQIPVDLEVPLISLVNHSHLSVKEMKLTMEVNLKEIIEAETKIDTPLKEQWKSTKHLSLLIADTDSSKKPSESGIAQIILTLTSEDAPEGLSRIIDHLNKTI